MVFDKNRVYTTLNADELKLGSKVITADNLVDLRHSVECEDMDISVLENIEEESKISRFYDGTCHWVLCYLVSEPEEKKLKWTDLKIGDVIRHKKEPVQRLITAIDSRTDDECHILAGDLWCNDERLEKYEKVEE